MTYQETLEYLFSKLPMYQRDGKSAYKKDLTNTKALLEALDNPHNKFKSVHIAGTNGKGTCAHAIASILQLAGYKIGLYTSPHLKNFTERIKINGSEIGEEDVVKFTDRIKPEIEKIKPSFFEITVAMAFDYFANQAVDIAVVETGLGGRLDSTNVLNPEACLITNIGYDHMDMLGDTLEKIAGEKAGIIKSAVPVVIGEYHEETFPVFIEKARNLDARIYLDHDFNNRTDTSTLPYHKLFNRNSVHMLARVLKENGWSISDQNIVEGFEHFEKITGLKGRFQVLEESPILIADVSHNAEGLQLLFSQVQSLVKRSGGQLFLVFGTVKDKDLTLLLKSIPKNAKIYWSQSSVPRSLAVEELAIQGVANGLKGHCFKNVNDAIKGAKEKAQPEDLILVTGSTFMVADIENL